MALDSSQLSRLGKTLDAKYVSLLEEVRNELETPENQQYVELIDRGPADSADQSIGDALADISLAVIDRHVKELRDIEAAQARIRDGSYGTCADCGCEIDLERLRVYPTAKRCITCQSQREKLYAHEGMHTL